MPAEGPEALVYPPSFILRIGVEPGLLHVRKYLDPEPENPDQEPYYIPDPKGRRETCLAVNYDDDISSQEDPEALQGPRDEEPHRGCFQIVKPPVLTLVVYSEEQETREADGPYGYESADY